MAAIDTSETRRLPLGIRLPESVSALGERDFRVVWIGQAISMTGTWMQMIAQGLLVLELWDSAFGLGVINFANALPSLVVMLFGGVLADRADKRRILLYTQAVMMLIAVAVGFLIVTDRVEFWMLVIAAAATGIAFGYDMPAYQAFLPELVPQEKIGQVVALNSSTFHGTRMVGPALAGLVIRAFGLATAYFLNALSFVAVLFSLLIVRSRHVEQPETVHVSSIEGLKQGFRHARGRPHVLILLALVALNTTFIFPIVAILTPFYVKEVLGEGPGVLGLLWASSGVGSVLGALTLIWGGSQARGGRFWAAALMAPAGLVVMAVVQDPVVAIVVQAFVSFAFSSQLGLIQMMLQESTPPQFRGRVMSLNGIMFNGTLPIAALVASGLAVVVGLPAVMVGTAVLYLVAAAALLSFGGGGIERVVGSTRKEYEALAVQSVVR